MSLMLGDNRDNDRGAHTNHTLNIQQLRDEKPGQAN